MITTITEAIAYRILAAQQNVERLHPGIVPPAWMWDAAAAIAVWIIPAEEADAIAGLMEETERRG